MTRIPWAEWYPGPLDRRGYGGKKTLPLNRKEGEVKHSTEGSLAAALGVLTDPTRQASWHFTFPKVGPVRVYQHYELEDITWHCGLPGDESHDTSLIGNITLIGEEHEGVVGEPWTDWQLENSVQLSRDLRAMGIGAEKPLAWKVNLWRHMWLSLTACDSFRAPENLPALIMEDDMDLAALEARVTELERQNAVQSEQIANALEANRVQSEQITTLAGGTQEHVDNQAIHGGGGAHKHETGPPVT